MNGQAWMDTGHILAPGGTTRRQLYIVAHEGGHIALCMRHPGRGASYDTSRSMKPRATPPVRPLLTGSKFPRRRHTRRAPMLRGASKKIARSESQRVD